MAAAAIEVTSSCSLHEKLFQPLSHRESRLGESLSRICASPTNIYFPEVLGIATVEWNHGKGVGPLYNKLTSLTLGEGTTIHNYNQNSQVSTSWLEPAGEQYVHSESAMPRRRRTSPTCEEVRPSKRVRSSNSGSKKRSSGDSGSSFSTKHCIAWFHEYSAPDSDDLIGPEGMEKFCEDIGVEPENIVMLSVAWKLNAKQMGFFTLAEWLKGMTDLQCDSIERIRHKLDHLRSLLQDATIFKNIYRYAFDFARDKDQRSMDIDTAKAMLALLLGKNWPLFPSFHQFLEQSKYRVINKDQWYNVLEFSRLIKPDLSNYEEDGAWPVMLDEFVEWYREQNAETAIS